MRSAPHVASFNSPLHRTPCTVQTSEIYAFAVWVGAGERQSIGRHAQDRDARGSHLAKATTAKAGKHLIEIERALEMKAAGYKPSFRCTE